MYNYNIYNNKVAVVSYLIGQGISFRYNAVPKTVCFYASEEDFNAMYRALVKFYRVVEGSLQYSKN